MHFFQEGVVWTGTGTGEYVVDVVLTVFDTLVSWPVTVEFCWGCPVLDSRVFVLGVFSDASDSPNLYGSDSFSSLLSLPLISSLFVYSKYL